MAFSRSTSTFLPILLAFMTLLPLVLSSPHTTSILHPRDDDDDEPGLHGTPSLRTAAHIAHGVTISIAIVLFFPLGGIILRAMQLHHTSSVIAVKFHIYWQLTGMLILFAGFGLGCWLSYLHNELWDFEHEQMGTVIFGLFLIQPVLGLVHHRNYRKLSEKGEVDELRPSLLTRIHTWYGRSLIVLGIVCGGTGMQLAADWTIPQMLVYLVVAVVIGAVYVVVLWVWWGKGRGRRRLRLGMPSLEPLPLGLPGERLDLPRGMFGNGSARGSEEKVGGVREVDEKKGVRIIT